MSGNVWKTTPEFGPLEQAHIDALRAVDGNGLKIKLFRGTQLMLTSDEMREQFQKFIRIFEKGGRHLRQTHEGIVSDAQAEIANLENLILMARLLKERLKADKLSNLAQGDP